MSFETLGSCILCLVLLTPLVGCGGRLAADSTNASSPTTDDASSPTTDDGSVEPVNGDSGGAVAPSVPVVIAEAGTASGDAGPPDATPVSPIVDSGFGDAALAAHCLTGGNVFYADGDHYPAVNGVVQIDGSQGTWSGTVTNAVKLQLKVMQADGGLWSFVASSGYVQSLTTGTYVSSGDAHSSFASVGNYENAGCAMVPTGSFTIASLGSAPGDDGPLTGLLAWFDLTCPSDGTTVVGCVNYTQ